MNHFSLSQTLTLPQNMHYQVLAYKKTQPLLTASKFCSSYTQWYHGYVNQHTW